MKYKDIDRIEDLTKKAQFWESVMGLFSYNCPYPMHKIKEQVAAEARQANVALRELESELVSRAEEQ